MTDEQHELLIQKCVDGELDVETQQQLLAQLDVMSEGWKILALAYVEEQTWTSSFSATNRVAQELETNAFLQTMQRMVDAEEQEVQCFMPPAQVDSDGRSKLLTQVTCLAIALVGGVLIGDIWRSRSSAGSVGTNIADNSKTDTPKTLTGNQSHDGSSLELAFPGKDGSSMNVPVYPYEQADGLPGVISELRMLEDMLELNGFEEELRRRGLRLEEDQSWIELELKDGRRALMPVNRWKVRPGGQ